MVAFVLKIKFNEKKNRFLGERGKVIKNLWRDGGRVDGLRVYGLWVYGLWVLWFMGLWLMGLKV